MIKMTRAHFTVLENELNNNGNRPEEDQKSENGGGPEIIEHED